jgi:hypothetical protein
MWLRALLCLAVAGVSAATPAPTLCDTALLAPKYFYFQPLDAFDMVIVTTTCSRSWNGANCTAARVPGYSLWTVRNRARAPEGAAGRLSLAPRLTDPPARPASWRLHVSTVPGAA